MLRPCVSASVAVALLGLPSSADGQNLLANPSFEALPNGLSGWTVVQSTPTVVSYGSPSSPPQTVADRIAGGTRLLRDGSHAIVEQIVAVSGGSNLHFGGYFGGSGSDDARMVLRFLDVGGNEIGLHPLETVTPESRNFEDVLMLREAIVAPPAGTVSVAARIEFTDQCCGGAFAAADALFVVPVTTPVVPPPLPSDTELLENGGFEDGWAPGSPLTLVDAQGWEGITTEPSVVKPYSDSDPDVPDTIVSCLIGGGQPSTSCLPGGAGNVLSDLGGNAGLRQRLDVRGNAPQFQAGTLALRVAAFLGGAGNQHDEARVDVRFLDARLTTIAPLPPVGPVTRAHRNGETVLLQRVREYFVPPSTAYVEVDVRFTNACCGAEVGLADNVSAMLVSPNPPPPVLLNQNLVSNGSFEFGSLPGSPLELTNQDGWFGGNDSEVDVTSYGASAEVPGTGFAAANGLGGLLLRHAGGDAILRQEFDVSAAAATIDVNRYRLWSSVWLGGHAGTTDAVELRLQFLNLAGGQVPGPNGLQTLGPVTAADRNQQTTLLERTGDFPVPPGTRRIVLEVRFTDECCGGAFATADDVRLVVYDTLFGGPSLLPGTGEDLRLFSGIDAPPTTGPGEDLLDASAFDVLNLRIESPDGTFDFAPLVLAANAYPTGGTPPTPPAVFPGLQLDPFQLLVMLDGVSCSGFGCAAVLPGGTLVNFPVPPGLSGVTVRMQAFALPVPGSGATPANGLFAASDAHELRIQ